MPNYNLVRFIACMLVVLHHVIAYFEIQKGVNFSFLKIFSNTCVPLFVLLSGALLLSKSENYLTFFKKRFKNVFIPFVFWILFYTLLRIITGFLNDSININLLLKNLVGIEGHPYYHLWYIYLIIFLYLITPLLKKIVNIFPEKYFFIVYLILFLFFQLISINFNNILWSNYLALYVMGNIISMLYNKKSLYFYLILICSLVFYYFENTTNISNASFSILIFLIIIKIHIKNDWIDFFMPLTLGIYLVHPLILKLVTKTYFFQNNIFLFFFIVFIISAFCTFLIKKIKFLNRIL